MGPGWFAIIFAIFMSLGMMKVIIGKNEALDKLNRKNGKLKAKSDKLYEQHIIEDVYKSKVEYRVVQGNEELRGLGIAVTKLTDKIETTKKQTAECEARKKKIADLLGGSEKKSLGFEAALKAAAEALKAKIATLRAQLKRRSPICAYVKNPKDPKVVKLCSTKGR